MDRVPTPEEVVAAVQAIKRARGQLKPQPKTPNSMPANVVGLTILLPFAAPIFVALFRSAVTQNPGALLPLFVFGGFAAATVIVLAFETFLVYNFDNFFVKRVVKPTGAVVLLFLAAGGAIRFIASLFGFKG